MQVSTDVCIEDIHNDLPIQFPGVSVFVTWMYKKVKLIRQVSTTIRKRHFTWSTPNNTVELDHIPKMLCMTLCIFSAQSTRGGNRDYNMLHSRLMKGTMWESHVLSVSLSPHLQLYTQYISSSFYIGMEIKELFIQDSTCGTISHHAGSLSPKLFPSILSKLSPSDHTD